MTHKGRLVTCLDRRVNLKVQVPQKKLQMPWLQRLRVGESELRALQLPIAEDNARKPDWDQGTANSSPRIPWDPKAFLVIS